MNESVLKTAPVIDHMVVMSNIKKRKALTNE